MPLATQKATPKKTTDFLQGATTDERAACVRLVRIMRTSTDYKTGYWLSFFVLWLLKLDAESPDDEVSIKTVEACILDMKNMENWSNWLIENGKREFMKDHPALKWIRAQDEIKPEVTAREELVEDREEIEKMFFAPDNRKTKHR